MIKAATELKSVKEASTEINSAMEEENEMKAVLLPWNFRRVVTMSRILNM